MKKEGFENLKITCVGNGDDEADNRALWNIWKKTTHVNITNEII